MPDPNARLDELIGRLKERDYRLTPQRMAVLRILTESRDHPTVEQVHRHVLQDFPMTSLATVYKTMALLKEIGAVLEIGIADGSNRYDGHNPHPHPHLICTKCKTIVDPDIASLERLPQEVAETTGFRVESHRLDFFGVCPQCQAGS